MVVVAVFVVIAEHRFIVAFGGGLVGLRPGCRLVVRCGKIQVAILVIQGLGGTGCSYTEKYQVSSFDLLFFCVDVSYW